MTDNARLSSVFFRKYIFQAVIALLCMLFLTVLSFSVCEKATESYAERTRYRTAELNEIVFSSVPSFEESLYCFGGGAYAFTDDGHRLSADVLMTVGGRVYKDNPLYLKSTLSEGTCAISRNLAAEFNVGIGETVSVQSGEKSFTFTVSEILPAQSGIDAKYMHKGIVILSENTALTETAKHIFVSFTKDWSGEYQGLVDDPARGDSVVFTEDKVKSAELSLFIYALLSTVALWVFIAVCEIFIFARMGRKYRDYEILSGYGISKARLFARVFTDCLIKYILPLLLNLLIWFIKLRIYKTAYLIPSAILVALGMITVLALTLITVTRKNRCPKIKR